jgi:hypothetical protein
MYYDDMVISITPKTQFTTQQIEECYKIAGLLGTAGKFNRFEVAFYDEKEKIKQRIETELNAAFLNNRDINSIYFIHSYFPKAWLQLHFAPKPEHLWWSPPFLLYVVHEDFVNKDDDGEHIKILLKVFKKWITNLKASYAHSYFGRFERIGRYPASRPLGSEIPITDLVAAISWATYFGPELVQYLGRDKILSSPVYKTEELETGGILILLVPKPMEPTLPEIHNVQARVREHLGLTMSAKNILLDALKKKKNGSPVDR